jgi:hypothetical protein
MTESVVSRLAILGILSRLRFLTVLITTLAGPSCMGSLDGSM